MSRGGNIVASFDYRCTRGPFLRDGDVLRFLASSLCEHGQRSMRVRHYVRFESVLADSWDAVTADIEV